MVKKSRSFPCPEQCSRFKKEPRFFAKNRGSFLGIGLSTYQNGVFVCAQDVVNGAAQNQVEYGPKAKSAHDEEIALVGVGDFQKCIRDGFGPE